MKDMIIRGGTVIDGTGNAGYRADVEVRNGVITAIGKIPSRPDVQILDADGLTVAPGFIDAHAHSDTSFLTDSSGASKLYQGITTEISGNCGSSPFPASEEKQENDAWACPSFSDFLKTFENGQYSMAVNQALLVGHGSLRETVLGPENRPATQEELSRMGSLLRRDLEAGAWGISLGLEYAPGCFSDTAELTALARIVSQYNGIITCHMRNEGLRIDEAIDELISVGRDSGAHVHVSHLKLDNQRVHGRAPEIWNHLEQARKTGIYITADMYPYTASSTTLSIRCPKWSLDGGDESLLFYLHGPRRQEILDEIRIHYPNAKRAETCLFSDDGGMWPGIVGKTLREVAETMLGTSDYAEAAAEVLLRTQARAWCVFFVMSEEDMRYFLSRDIRIGSDGRALSGDPAKVRVKPHPRNYGAIAEFFRLIREDRICSTEEAVRRVTGATADCFSLKHRGYLKPGYIADITVFDPETISPRATYLEPVRLATGVQHVIISGKVALKNGAQTEAREGRFLRRKKPDAES